MFNIGDEIIVVDDSPMEGVVLPIRNGQTFTVIGAHPKGAAIPGGFETLIDCVSIGVINPYHVEWARIWFGVLMNLDIWDAERFRKVERKRTREELHALIGISDMLGQRAPELV